MSIVSKNMPGQGREKTQFKDKGVGVGGRSPLSFQIQDPYDAMLRSLPNRSEKIRQWVIEGLERMKTEEKIRELLENCYESLLIKQENASIDRLKRHSLENQEQFIYGQINAYLTCLSDDEDEQNKIAQEIRDRVQQKMQRR